MQVAESDIDTCEANGIEFLEADGQWSWRTTADGDSDFDWHNTGLPTKEKAAKHCQQYCQFGE